MAAENRGRKPKVFLVTGGAGFIGSKLVYVLRMMEDIDYVFHLAAISSISESFRSPLETNAVNLVGTINILEAARNIPVV